ncbi:unnamed protein product [Leuciscus chuanchicus]
MAVMLETGEKRKEEEHPRKKPSMLQQGCHGAAEVTRQTDFSVLLPHFEANIPNDENHWHSQFALVVAGSKFEAMDGQNVTISFDTDEVEKADEVRITFKEDKKEYAELIAQKPWVYDDPPRPGVTLIVGKGCLSVIIQNVNISRSGLYKAEAYTGEKVCEVTATLVVNKAPVSSSPAPPHSSSSPTPLSSSDLHWLYALIPLVIVVSGGVYFWKLRRASCQKQSASDDEGARETPAVSRSSVSTERIGKDDCVAVAMNGCGEHLEALLTSS